MFVFALLYFFHHGSIRVVTIYFNLNLIHVIRFYKTVIVSTHNYHIRVYFIRVYVNLYGCSVNQNHTTWSIKTCSIKKTMKPQSTKKIKETSKKNKKLKLKLIKKIKDELKAEISAALKKEFEVAENRDRDKNHRFQTPPYVLSDQVLFRNWLTRIKSELEAYELSYVIDTKIPAPSTSEELKNRRTSMVRNIILSRLDEKHLRLVEGECDPLKLIEKLATHREAKTMAGEYASYRELHNMVYDARKTSAQDFLLQFNNLLFKVEEYEKSKSKPEDWKPWSDSRKK